MTHLSVCFVATVAVVSLLLQLLGATEAASLPTVLSSAVAFVQVPMSVLVQKVQANTQRISLLSADFSALSAMNFAVSCELLAEIVPYDPVTKDFTLPESPTLTTLSKLIFVLKANTCRLGMLASVVKKYSHYDPLSTRMFQTVVEAFDTIARLHNSINHLENPSESYGDVLHVISQVVDALTDFVQRFSSSILIDRIDESQTLKSIVLSNVAGMFYILQNVLQDDFKFSLVDLMFSAVGTTEEEQLLWASWKRIASPSTFLPLPFEFLTSRHVHEITKTLSSDLVAVFSIDATLDAGWLNQIGTLVRLRLLSEVQILKLMERIACLSEASVTSSYPEAFLEFLRLVFFNESALPNCPKVALNFLSRPVVPLSRSFYETLWFSFVYENQNIVPNQESEYAFYLSAALQKLENQFPGIVNDFPNDDISFAPDSLRFTQSLAKVPLVLDGNDQLESMIQFIQNGLMNEFELFKVQNIRFRLDFIFSKVLGILEAIETSDIEDPFQFKLLLQVLGQVFVAFKSFLEFLPQIGSVQVTEVLVDFAFKLETAIEAESVSELVFLILKRSDGENLLEAYFQRIAHNLVDRPDFFAVRIDRKMFSEIPPVVLASFLESIKESVEFSEAFLSFLGVAYLNDAVSPELLFFYLDKLSACNELDFASDLTTFIDFFSSIIDVSFLEYERDKSAEYFQRMHRNSQAISIKSFQVLLALLDNPEIDSEIALKIGNNLIPWICARLATFGDIKPELKESNQFTADILNGGERALIAAQIIKKLLLTGASSSDLQNIFAFIRDSHKMFGEVQKINLNYSASFTLIVFILRADDAIIPVSYISEMMGYFKFRSFRICAPQLIYNSIKSASIREALFARLVSQTFDLLDHSFLLDMDIFNGFSQVTRSALLAPFMRDTFLAKGIDRMKLEALCYWMARGLVPLEQARVILQMTSAERNRPTVLKLGIALLRAILKRTEYISLRQAAVNDLFFKSDHTLLAPKPFILGMVSSVTDFFAAPEFLAAFGNPPSNEYASDILALIQSEVNRIQKVSNSGALYLSEGIDNVLETYNNALIKIHSFGLPLHEKVFIFKSITRNLTRLTTDNGKDDYIDEEFATTRIDYFVRVSIYLAIQIFIDPTGPAFSLEIERETIALFLDCLVQYVCDSNVQGLLVYYLFDVVKSRPDAGGLILDLLPKYLNVRRFIILIENFRIIFNFNGSVERFDKFMMECIEAAFRFEDLTTTDAVDLSRDPSQSMKVHGSFFMVMASLIQQYNLPVRYTLNALKLMNENSEAIEVISPYLVQFLHAAIKIPRIDPESVCYRITKRSYGDGAVYHDQPAVIREVLSFLSKRPEFVEVAINNGPESEPHHLMLELKRIASDHELYRHPAIQTIQTFFEFHSLPIESVKLLHSIELPDSTFRNIASWLSSLKNTSNESVVRIAFLAVSMAPSSFVLESFTDNHLSCNSWLHISVTVIEWISKLSTDFPRKFGQVISQMTLHKILNLFLWNLEYDGAEEFVSKAFLNVLNALAFADDSIKYSFIKLLGNPQFRSLTRTLRLNYATNIQMCSIFRLWTSALGNNLEREVESLVWALLEDGKTFPEEEIISKRADFLLELKKLDSYGTLEGVKHSISEIMRKIPILRSMHEVDLVLIFIKKLAAATRRFYGQVRSEATGDFSILLGVTLHSLRTELLLQSDSSVFLDFFKFLFRHTSSEKSTSYFEAVELLFSQIRSSDLIQRTLAVIIEELRLEASLIPARGFPKHFYAHNLTHFAQDYLEKMNLMGTRNAAPQFGVQGVTLDGIHFLMIFNVLHEMNASDNLFRIWFENISRIHENDLCGDYFAHNLKAHCIKRPHLVDNLIKIYINQSFVDKAFDSLLEPSRGNVMAVFKLMLKSNPKLFQERVALLPLNLQRSMNDSIVGPFLLMKRKLVQDFIDKCRLPELKAKGFTVTSITELLPNLVILLKMDITGVVLPDKSKELFAHLNSLTSVLFSSGHSSDLELNLMTIVLALQSKNQVPFLPQVLDRVIRLQNQDPPEEVSNLLLKQILGTDLITFCSQHVPFLAKLIVKSNDPNQIILDIVFRHRRLSIFAVEIIQNILNTPGVQQVELNMAVEVVISELITANRFGSEFKSLVLLAKNHKLLSKTQILLLDQINSNK